ncbi:MAG TPA: DUF4258 domain-containing protein [Chitinophagaceae bacterium]|nr:DUF4258 domain-containing protein [Chitinophagaceae bacterium]
MKKVSPYILLLLMAVLLFFLKRCKENNAAEQKQNSTASTSKQKASSADVNRDRGFDRRTAYLDYSKHASCRMECRHITKSEVEDIMQNGKINYNKSDIKNARCPRYAVEGITKDDQKIRIVFAQCNEKTNVVTVIDLDTDWSCLCPGDDDKYENRN